jgi:murein L,D-transpeptidase YcbB/YkuD
MLGTRRLVSVMRGERMIWRSFILLCGLGCLAMSAAAQAAALDFAEVWANPIASRDRLAHAAVAYRSILDSGGWRLVPDGPKLQLGDDSERVRTLRTRLGLSGSARFDAAVEAEVRRFQERHGLVDDGVVGQATLAALNVPIAERLAQIERGLERFDRLPPLGEAYVVVNVAAMLLAAVERGEPVLQMRVVVGRPDWPTPRFSSAFATVTFSPEWLVPPSIAAQEIQPRALHDPGYLARNRIELVDGSGRPLGYDIRAALASGVRFRFRQRPGDDNALGRVRLAAPNPYSVFLHGTPQGSLFNRASRAFSHGCVRLEQPLDLARWLLADQPQWDDPAIAEATAGAQPTVVPVTRPAMLHLVYMTAWADPSGLVHFRPDIYKADSELREERVARANASGDCQKPIEALGAAG